MDGLTEGRIVHYVLPDDHPSAGQHRPMIIVRVWDKSSGMVSGIQFADGTNDTNKMGVEPHTVWRSSKSYSEAKEGDTWHWIDPA